MRRGAYGGTRARVKAVNKDASQIWELGVSGVLRGDPRSQAAGSTDALTGGAGGAEATEADGVATPSLYVLEVDRGGTEAGVKEFSIACAKEGVREGSK